MGDAAMTTIEASPLTPHPEPFVVDSFFWHKFWRSWQWHYINTVYIY